jgi:malonate transporter MadL subunit
MAIYGTALLSLCLVCGLIAGKLIGLAIGVDANIGGVGLAMLLLILVSSRLQTFGCLPQPTRNGVLFWSSIYIPIVVALAASQNVRGAVSGGKVAIVAGLAVVIVGFAAVPLFSRMGRTTESIISMSDAALPGDEP